MSLGHNVVTVVKQATNFRQALKLAFGLTRELPEHTGNLFTSVQCFLSHKHRQNGTTGEGALLCGQGQKGQTRALRIRAFAFAGWRHR